MFGDGDIQGMPRFSLQGRRSTDARWDINEVKNACLIINTADYCQTTAQEVSVLMFFSA